jgi:hypothetical protein
MKKTQSNKGFTHKNLLKKNPIHPSHMEMMGGVKLKSSLGMANNV